MRARLQTLSLLLLLFVSGNARAAQWTVEIYDFYFTPTNLTVGLGDTVTWINRVTRAHDTTQFDPNNPDLLLWASDLLSKDQSFSYTFTSLGNYPYVCAVHYAQHSEQTGTVSVAQANLPPSVSITNPVNGATFTTPANFNIGATAADADGSVASVEFFLNGTSVGASQGPAFTGSVNALSAGNYAITAVARDNLGAANTSAAVNIVVQDAPMKFPLTLTAQPSNAGSVAANPLPPVDGYDSGARVTLTASAANGFAFIGWSGAITTAENPTTVIMDAARNVMANFAVSSNATQTLTLSANPANGGAIQVSPAPNGANGTYVRGTVVTLTAVPTNGFLFTNFGGAINTATNPVSITLDADLSVTANFVTNTSPVFTLTLFSVPPLAGAIEVSGPPTAPGGGYYEGSVVTLLATGLGTNAFANWSGAITSTSRRVTLVIVSNTTMAATFVPVIPPAYTLVVAVSPTNAGTVSASPPPNANGTYAPGTTVALAAQPRAGFRFANWSGASSETNNPILITMTGDKSVTANFIALPTLDFVEHGGAYAGLLLDAPAANSSTNLGTEYATLGFISLRVTKTGAYRGAATVGGIRQSIAGQFDRFGYAPLVLRRGTLSGSLQIDSESGRITGLLTDGIRAPSLLLERAMEPADAVAFAGDYPLVFGANEVVSSEGTARLRVSQKGYVQLRGRLGDGTAFTTRTFLTRDASIPIFASLYGKRGAVLGWLDLSGNGNVQGRARWLRPGNSRSQNFPYGFVLEIPVSGAGE